MKELGPRVTFARRNSAANLSLSNTTSTWRCEAVCLRWM